jgi:hypothetical protein
MNLSTAAPFVPIFIFSNVQPFFYWSATTDAANTSFSWVVFFGSGSVHVGGFVPNGDKTVSNYVWCVRGGRGVNPQ